MNVDRDDLHSNIPSFEKIIRGQRHKKSGEDSSLNCCGYNPPSLGYMYGKTEFLQQSLRSQLQLTGLNPGWLLSNGSSLYSQAIYNLTKLVDKATIQPIIKDGAKEELDLLTDSLTLIFCGRIKLAHKEEPSGIHCFSGFSEKLLDATKRITISQRLKDSIHPITKRPVYPNTQIEIKDTEGISTNRRAIAGSDSSLRIGFRVSWAPVASWTISIDSIRGGTFNRYCRPRIQSINPLSNAIKTGRLNKDTPSTTFHYPSENSRLDNPEETIASFNDFNERLNQVFLNLSKV